MNPGKFFAAIVLLQFASISLAQTTQTTTAPTTKPTPPAYTAVRWDEDYSYLKNPANRSDFFDPVKYIALGDKSYLSFGGQARYRYEFFNNNNFGAGPQDDNGYHLTRLLLHADLHLGENFRFFAQGKSSMSDDREGGPRGSDSDEVDVQQAFADVILPLNDKTKLTIRGGRQELTYGAQRLISPSDWSNTLRTFEGGKVMLAIPNQAIDMFWVRPVDIDNEEPNVGNGDNSFAGVYDTISLPKVFEGAGTKLEIYQLALNTSGGNDADTYTAGVRFSSKPKPWDFDVEADYQFGNLDSDSISAYSLALEGGYTFPDLALTPRLYLGFDIASGSADGTGRFNQLFPSGHHYFGYIDAIGRMNIIDLHPGLSFKLTKDLTFKVEEHIFWRQNINDAVYNASGNVLRADNGSNAAYIGNEIDFVLTWQVTRHLNTYVGYSHFFAGEFIDQTGPDEDIDFVYAAVSYTF